MEQLEQKEQYWGILYEQSWSKPELEPAMRRHANSEEGDVAALGGQRRRTHRHQPRQAHGPRSFVAHRRFALVHLSHSSHITHLRSLTRRPYAGAAAQKAPSLVRGRFRLRLRRHLRLPPQRREQLPLLRQLLPLRHKRRLQRRQRASRRHIRLRTLGLVLRCLLRSLGMVLP